MYSKIYGKQNASEFLENRKIMCTEYVSHKGLRYEGVKNIRCINIILGLCLLSFWQYVEKVPTIIIVVIHSYITSIEKIFLNDYRKRILRNYS